VNIENDMMARKANENNPFLILCSTKYRVMEITRMV
jgi:hypothetical protein